MLTLTFLTFLAGAQPAVAAEKIAYVDMARALQDVDDGKDALNTIKKDFEAKQRQLDKEQAKLKKKKSEFDKRVSTMLPGVKVKKQQKLQEELVKLQQLYMKMQQELAAEQGRLTKNIVDKLRRVITKIGSKEKYTMILNIGEAVLYHQGHLDITDDVVKAYNQQFRKN